MQYEIVSKAYPVVVCHLGPGEQMKTERGSMVWMDSWIDMATKTGDIGGVFERVLTGESIFQNVYTATRPGKVAFGSSFPGRIVPIAIAPGREFIVQKMGFLASEMGVELSMHVNQRIGGGFFGGEGFIMQRLSGCGTAFIEVDGDLVSYELAAGEQLVVNTGNVLGFTAGVTLDIQAVRGGMNLVFGGEGVFNTVLTGPGTVWLQTMPMASLVDAILPSLKANKR
ncbi:TIGR00266 family protein [Collinsella tanakaei]|uniref:TIGR00266 family protein n=1 Tax=Collinsella ihumii TaxID=1720204 RepID=A0A921ISQ8_9ACTN|nr:TIGR00266 family protein [Collinsella ihumii]MBM6786221.1 TIGR00266 family protein [Collinsella tanakaei]MCF6412383.1 TIGR00266 family protein [Collinsella tanakaei]MDN0054794.1 TIGR00266 family protein [Collinsella ihumii]MDN0063126.1 TIGR00266 family protein [Collinsella ihumii]MDN0069917.1 TIGR00266 family protein [Collinsella ihumii]